MEIQHFSHKHPLTFKIMNPSDTNSVSCYACRKSCVDLIYSCKVCNGHHLHKSCAELPEKITEHPFHPAHPLPLVFSGGSYACCGCGKWDSTLLYWCKACNFTLSPDCALKPTLKYEFLGQGQIRHFLHKHPLSFMETKLTNAAGDVCSACEKSCSGKMSYYCRQCPSFKLHRSCAEQLPRAIQHIFHMQHPMILRAKDYTFDRPCHTCKRTDNALTYRCSMCRIEMDPTCALATSTNIA
ncbi:uncharacterized protein LOC116212300 [Punica granatum]|uniref:DC1 domain-containing protein n=2 Tax=Punica granatum TaxID=22663 RepID=A0A218W9F8_PUNGR|nr:uncharacterized protein LOC116212300 [Punica granatum]OWM69119.1 hypothetical protein CDL15_Pgr025306 [Punica granatum]PKI57797.1 hypothetical protein CRG98_021864 [Punica granatum]